MKRKKNNRIELLCGEKDKNALSNLHQKRKRNIAWRIEGGWHTKSKERKNCHPEAYLEQTLNNTEENRHVARRKFFFLHCDTLLY